MGTPKDISDCETNIRLDTIILNKIQTDIHDKKFNMDAPKKLMVQ